MSDNGHDPAWAFPVYPQLQWNDRDYAQLKGRLHLFEDHIVLEKFDKGQPTEVYLVDPLDLAGRLNTLGLTSGPLPRNCLFWSRQDGEDRLGIYIEPQIWPVSVTREKKTGHVPLARSGLYRPGPKIRLNGRQRHGLAHRRYQTVSCPPSQHLDRCRRLPGQCPVPGRCPRYYVDRRRGLFQIRI